MSERAPEAEEHSRAGWDADQAVVALFDTHYRSLTRLVMFLVGDLGRAEQIVQDAFVRMHGIWRQLRGSEEALAYLKQTVISQALASQARRTSAAAVPAPRADGYPRASAPAEPELTAALRALPPAQREALVLRYYADLTETQIAAAMGISTRALGSYLTSGMSSLQTVLAQYPG